MDDFDKAFDEYSDNEEQEEKRSEAYFSGVKRYNTLGPDKYDNPYHPSTQKQEFEDFSQGWNETKEATEGKNENKPVAEYHIGEDKEHDDVYSQASPEIQEELKEGGYEYSRTQVLRDGAVEHQYLDASKTEKITLPATEELASELRAKHSAEIQNANQERITDAELEGINSISSDEPVTRNEPVAEFDVQDFGEIEKAFNNAPREVQNKLDEGNYHYNRSQVLENGEVNHQFQTHDKTEQVSVTATPEVAESLREQAEVELNSSEVTAAHVHPDIDRKFRIEEKGKKTIYSYANDPDRIAFTEKGSTLETQENNPQLIKNMLQVADDKGWESVQLKGSDEFKREAWMEAKLRGFNVKGYEPNEQDLRRLETETEKRGNSITDDTKKELDENDKAVIGDTTLGEKSENNQGRDALGNDPDSAGDASIPPISEEGKAIRAKQLKTAVATLDKDDALEKYPELEAAYEVQPAAIAYYRQQGGLAAAQEQEFVNKTTDRAIEDIADGREVPNFDVNTYKTQDVDPVQKPRLRQEREVAEIDFE